MTKEEILHWLDVERRTWENECQSKHPIKEALYAACKLLEREAKWIPVTEGLPKEHLCKDGYIEPSDYVLVWGDSGSYGVSRYWGNRRSKAKSPNTYKDWLDLEWVAQKPIAWMPLPQPYKAESEG